MNRSSYNTTFEGKVVILTGAGSGMGKALAAMLQEAGAIVFAVDVNEDGLSSLTKSDNLICVSLDVTDAEAYQGFVDEVIRDHGNIDYLFNNAGVTLLSDAVDISSDQWKALLDVNIMGVCNGIAAVYPQMVKAGKGHIINTSSIAAVTGYATAAPYTCSKAFVVGLTRSLRPEAKQHNVDVSLVCPGYVNTNIFTADRIIGADLDKVFSRMPFKFISSEKAADYILAGVSRRKKKIIFPFSSKFLWFLSHWAPFMLAPFQRGFLKPFREGKSPS